MTTEDLSTDPHPRPGQRRVLIAERRATVLDRRKAGHTLRDIAAELGVSHRTVFTDEQAALKAIITPAAGEVRKLELERLESLWKIAYAIASNESATVEQRLRAVDSCLRVAQRRAAMEGIDEPTRFDVTPWLERLAREQGLDVNVALETARAVVADLGF